MPYKCLKCGSEDTYPLTVKIFEAETTIPINAKDEGDVAFGTKVEDAGIIINCKKCDNFGHPSDKSKFSIVNN